MPFRTVGTGTPPVLHSSPRPVWFLVIDCKLYALDDIGHELLRSLQDVAEQAHTAHIAQHFFLPR